MDSSTNDNSWSFTTANIIDYEKLCLQTVCFRAPKLKEAFSSIEVFSKESKLIADRNGVEYDTYSLIHVLKDMEITVSFETIFLDILVHVNYYLYKSKLFDNFKDVLINEYMMHVEKSLSTSLNGPVDLNEKIQSTAHQTEIIVRKLLKVFHFLNPDPELCIQNLGQYEFLAELLKMCYSVNVQDSQLVTSLLKLIIDRCAVSGITHVRQPHYPHGFFKYLLMHVTRAKFDLVQYCSDHPRTLWEYARNFSVVYAAAFGNPNRVLCLLQHGFNVFPDSDLRHSGHGQPYVKEIMPRTNCMILQIMSRMRLVNCFTSDTHQMPENDFYIATPRQEECFRLIWRALSEPFVTVTQLVLDISTEYFYLALHAIFKPFRHNRNMKLGVMYKNSFEDMANGPHEPRSLKHLCRCSIRKRLHETWNLPSGVFQLYLPESLEKYLNLECD